MKDDNQLSQLVRMDSPEAVLGEVLVILGLISPEFNTAPVTSAFNKAISLYDGTHPGYRPCNTGFHDLRHTTDTFLAQARLIHGAVLDGETFTEREIVLGLIAAVLHDAGYIQEEHDTEGTGAKHTTTHVQRSMDFLQRHGAEYGLSKEEIAAGRAMILCTDLAADISTIEFPSAAIELLGKILGAADLLAQMADRTYLEKLLFLYHEFKEADIGGYESEVDLLQKTVGFYEFIAQRFETTLDSTDLFMISHFASRWNIDTNLYHVAIQRQKNYLQQILEMAGSDPRDHLRRDGVIDRVREKHGEKD